MGSCSYKNGIKKILCSKDRRFVKVIRVYAYTVGHLLDKVSGK